MRALSLKLTGAMLDMQAGPALPEGGLEELTLCRAEKHMPHWHSIGAARFLIYSIEKRSHLSAFEGTLPNARYRPSQDGKQVIVVQVWIFR